MPCLSLRAAMAERQRAKVNLAVQRFTRRDYLLRSADLPEELLRLANPAAIPPAAQTGQVMKIIEPLFDDFGRLGCFSRHQQVLGEKAFVVQTRRHSGQFSTTCQRSGQVIGLTLDVDQRVPGSVVAPTRMPCDQF